MFITAFIVSVKKNVIIPEEWVFDVNQELLKNKGVNSNRNVLIYWSKSAIGNDGIPNAMHVPNFSATKSVVFPPTTDEACYLARTTHYFESFEKALAYCQKFRAQLPAIYNYRRQFDRPIPSLNPAVVSESENDENTDNEMDGENDLANGNDHEIEDINDETAQSSEHDFVNENESGIAENTDNEMDGENDLANENDPEILDTNNEIAQSSVRNFVNENEPENAESFDNETEQIDENDLANDHDLENETISNETAQSYVRDIVDENEPGIQNDLLAAAFGIDGADGADGIDLSYSMQNNQNDLANGQNQSKDGFSGSNAEIKHTLQKVSLDYNDELAMNTLFNIESSSQPDESSDHGMELNHGETSEKLDGKATITKVIDDDLEMTYVRGEKPKPLQPLYHVKMNDPISEHIPFKENDEKDRAYLVQIDGRYQEVKMAALLVNGLLCLNKNENRDNANFDKPFIKALIISLHTLKKIDIGEPMKKDLLIFIRELFLIRIHSGDADGSRYRSFDALVNMAYEEARKNNYT